MPEAEFVVALMSTLLLLLKKSLSGCSAWTKKKKTMMMKTMKTMKKTAMMKAVKGKIPVCKASSLLELELQQVIAAGKQPRTSVMGLKSSQFFLEQQQLLLLLLQKVEVMMVKFHHVDGFYDDVYDAVYVFEQEIAS